MIDERNKCSGVPQYTHYGTWSLGVDMRAEVGILSRDIKIHGEMQPGCYDNNLCDYFDYDTFGGQTEVTTVYFTHLDLVSIVLLWHCSQFIRFHFIFCCVILTVFGGLQERARGGCRTLSHGTAVARQLPHSLSPQL